MELGINGAIFEKDISHYQHALLTESWVRNTWEFTSQFQISLSLDNPCLPLRREGDCEIMGVLYNNTHAPTKDWATINRCRIYLRVHSLADIVTGDGTAITSSAANGIRRLETTRTHIQWPLWEKPQKKDWAIWRKFLKRAFTGTNRERRLTNPLGRWLHTIPEDWKWYLPLTETYLVEKRADGWYKYKKKGRSWLSPRFVTTPCLINNAPPSEALRPTTVSKRNDSIFAEGCSSSLSLPVPPMSKSPIISMTEDFTNWLFVSISESDDLLPLVHDILEGKARAVSDGSYQEDAGFGTAAWTIESSDKTAYISGTSISPGPPHIQNA